ncbi:MAG: cation:dicarboxylase symporter family transporter [Novosphingobium sp.]|nr:cation:dicarboxylase symporter family transporter [Novosphingobium sp.]
MPDVRLPALPTFLGLALGIGLGLLAGGRAGFAPVIAVVAPVGTLWLRALQMTIIPLVSALLVIGVVQTAEAAAAGRIARRTLGLFAAILLVSTVVAALVVPPILDSFPIPARAAQALRASGGGDTGPVPSLADFFAALVPANIIQAAASDAVLPTIVFFALFAVALTRLPRAPRQLVARLFAAIAAALLVVIGWVLRLAPVGVFALSFAVAAKSGSATIVALAHYIAVVSSIGGLVLIAAYVLAVAAARQRLAGFAATLLPVQAVALSTQSSLASLPAMLAACRELGLRQATAEFVLPLAVALFRATGPGMNVAVAIYVARLTGVAVPPQALAAGVLVAFLTTIGAVSLPGAISYITSIAPIALAMGVPVAPLALLVAVEMLPDLMRTVGNVTMDVAVTATVDRWTRQRG